MMMMHGFVNPQKTKQKTCLTTCHIDITYPHGDENLPSITMQNVNSQEASCSASTHELCEQEEFAWNRKRELKLWFRLGAPHPVTCAWNAGRRNRNVKLCALWWEREVLAGPLRSNCTVNWTLCNKQPVCSLSHTVCSSSTKDYDIFINCNWVVTRWQYTFTHEQYIEQHK
jgi:hypothetical protein